MELNNRNLQDMLSKCLFGGNWEKYKKFVIPRKGNFLNPQYLTETDTYAIYYIDKKEKRVTDFQTEDYTERGAETSRYATVKMRIVVQFIGLKAEEWANTLLFWDERTDVQKILMEYQSQLLLGERVIETVPFQQEGYNGEMSYMASFETVSNVSKEEIVGYWTSPVIFEGGLKVEK